LPGSDILDKEAETEKAHRLIYPMRTLSWWLLHKGTDLPSLP